MHAATLTSIATACVQDGDPDAASALMRLCAPPAAAALVLALADIIDGLDPVIPDRVRTAVLMAGMDPLAERVQAPRRGPLHEADLFMTPATSTVRAARDRSRSASPARRS